MHIFAKEVLPSEKIFHIKVSKCWCQTYEEKSIWNEYYITKYFTGQLGLKGSVDGEEYHAEDYTDVLEILNQLHMQSWLNEGNGHITYMFKEHNAEIGIFEDYVDVSDKFEPVINANLVE